jgi:protein gp37
MAQYTSIPWTDYTLNVVRGCTKVSPGCAHCYAEKIARRFRGKRGNPYERGFDLRVVPSLLDKPYRLRKPRMIFVDSMSDLFHEKVPEAYLQAVFSMMQATPRHTYQILTKRADRLAQLAPRLPWPKNVWMGVSVETQAYVDRVDRLREVPAAVRFISAEPLLGPLTLDLTGIQWVIAGGESGSGFRPMDAAWVRSVRDQCVAASVPFFFKQWSGCRPKRLGRELDGRAWSEMPEAASRLALGPSLAENNTLEHTPDLPRKPEPDVRACYQAE